jgi:hypothetical protein
MLEMQEQMELPCSKYMFAPVVLKGTKGLLIKIAYSAIKANGPTRKVWKVTGENLKFAWAEFSTWSKAV